MFLWFLDYKWWNTDNDPSLVLSTIHNSYVVPMWLFAVVYHVLLLWNQVALEVYDYMKSFLRVLHKPITFGLYLHGRTMLSVNSVCRSNLHHRWSGKSGCTPHKIETKWFLNVWMAFSATFLRCKCGGTSWNLMLFLCRYSFIWVEASLSSIWWLGLYPRAVRYSWILVVILYNSPPVLLCSGLTRIAFVS